MKSNRNRFSQVLNLNLSNLLLLLVLKAVVFGAGYIGNHGYKGRDLEDGIVLYRQLFFRNKYVKMATIFLDNVLKKFMYNSHNYILYYINYIIVIIYYIIYIYIMLYLYCSIIYWIFFFFALDCRLINYTKMLLIIF